MKKSEIEKIIGGESFFNRKRLVGKLDYMGGVESFDKHLDESTYMNNVTCINLFIHANGIQVMMLLNLNIIRTAIKFEDIKSISIESGESITTQKDKSVLGRTILGGLVFGGIGAIVGAASGLNNSETVSKKTQWLR